MQYECNNNSHMNSKDHTLNSDFQYEYMYRSHTETRITAGFGFKFVPMEGRIARGAFSGEET